MLNASDVWAHSGESSFVLFVMQSLLSNLIYTRSLRELYRLQQENYTAMQPWMIASQAIADIAQRAEVPDQMQV